MPTSDPQTPKTPSRGKNTLGRRDDTAQGQSQRFNAGAMAADDVGEDPVPLGSPTPRPLRAGNRTTTRSMAARQQQQQQQQPRTRSSHPEPNSDPPRSPVRQHRNRTLDGSMAMRPERPLGSVSTASAYASAIASADKPAPRLAAPASGPASQTSSRGRRPRSPVKGMTDLIFAAKPIRRADLNNDPDVPDTVDELYRKLRKIHKGEGVVPVSIEAEARAREHVLHSRIQDIDSQCLMEDPLPPRPTAELLLELDMLSKALQQARSARLRNCSEAHWNERVHSVMLEAALEMSSFNATNDVPVIGFFNATTARIAEAWAGSGSMGLALQDKMIDYCMVIQDDEMQTACKGPASESTRRMQDKRFRRGGSSASASASASSSDAGRDPEAAYALSVSGTTSSTQDQRRKWTVPQPSANHTEYDPLRLRPIAVSIETKKPDVAGDVAITQLSVWATAHLTRLHDLLLHPSPIPMPLPLIYVSGNLWQVYFAVEREDHIVVFDTFSIEGTSTLLGCYKVLAMLRVLRDWSAGPFRDWLLLSLQSLERG
ncbi:hypothetical protein ColLi_13242 [Colletotrichum liriopes]|uniref:PD-(D/E)XK nuclease-like domain-containing protein n=1 Tax=Colletotrichum liriopes TaxID=708192 RepID=A0AA37GZU7_9PEZI|nr:hypothetical protein ColLi_13242 [Colletotrichum liriopes]